MSLGTIKRIKTVVIILLALWMSSVVTKEFFYTNSPTARYSSIGEYLAYRTPLIESGVSSLVSRLLQPKPTDAPMLATSPSYTYLPSNSASSFDIPQAVTLKKRGANLSAVELDTVRQLDTNYKITEVTTNRGLVEVVSPLQSQVPTTDLQALGRINDLLEERGM